MIVQGLLASIKANSTLLNGLVGYWNLNGNSTAQVGGNGTDTAITYSAGNGKIIQGAGLNGTTSKIVIPDSASYKVTTGFTINAWMKSSDTTGIGVVFSYLNTDSALNTPYGGYFLRYIANKLGVIATRYNSSGAIDVNTTGTTNICDGTFKMVTAIYDGTNIKTYINGVLETTTAYTSALTYVSPNNYPRIGVWTSDRLGDIQFFNGAIDEVGVWNRGITGTELSEIYNSGAGKTHPF